MSLSSPWPPLLRRRRCRRDRSRPARHPCRSGCHFHRRLHRVSFELARRAELAQLVSHHVLADVHRDELLPVVHRDGVSHHVRVDGRTARPGAQHLLLIALVHVLNALHHVRIDERSFFCRTCHSFLILFAVHTASKSFAAHTASKSTFTSPVNDHLVCALVVARLVSAGRLSPGRDRMASA